MAIQIAQKKNAKLRMALSGTSGSGKTYSSLVMAAGLGRKIGVIDSERGSASLYVGSPGIPEFGVLELESASVADYIKAISEFAAEGYDVLIVDSLSHSWQAALEAVDRAGGWVKAGKTVSPALQKLTTALLTYPGHVIATMRSKTEYAIEKDEKTGKTTMKKLGLAPQVRGDTEYEFTVMLDLTREGTVTVSKSRCGDALPMDQIYERADLPKIAERVRAWLAKGAPLSVRAEALERIKFVADQAALPAVVAFLKEKKDQMSAEDLAEVKAALVAKKAELADLEGIE